MSTDSHSAMAAEISRLRAALQQIERAGQGLLTGTASLPGYVRRIIEQGIVGRASAALASGDGATSPEGVDFVEGHRFAVEQFARFSDAGIDARGWAEATLKDNDTQSCYQAGYVAGLKAALKGERP